MSASFLVDLGNTTQQAASLVSPPLLSGSFIAVGSGTLIGQGIYLGNANSACNVFAAGVTASGQLRLQVQTAGADVSGQYTDPTSGLAQLPGGFQSGGILWINSGGVGNGIFGAFVSGQCVASGFFGASYFQRPQQGLFARVNVLSEGSAQFAGALTAGFITQLRTTGSGGGSTQAPGSGVVNV